MSAFRPQGDQARWRTVYDELRKAATGSVVTYEQLGHALSMDPEEDRHAIQMAVRRAAAEHEREDKRAIDVVPNEGYRIAEAREHLTLARRQQKRAGRSLGRGHSKAVNVDLSGVDPDVRHALEVTATAFAMQMDFNRRFAVRQSRLESAVQEITTAQAGDRQRSAEEIARLRARVERLERGEST